MNNTKALVIVGPTATGKTDLALQLANKFQGELISCDSRQIYKGLDIGTGKMPSKGKVKIGEGFWEIDGVRIWMYDVVSPKIQYTVAAYVKDAEKILKEIKKRGKLSIIVGGSGLYLKALLDGLPNLEIPLDEGLRKQLNKLTKHELQERLREQSLKRWNELNQSDRENPRRLVRAIEVSNVNMRLPRHFVPRNDVLRIGFTAPREVLYKRVDDHVLNRINQGMIEEAKTLHNKGLSFERMRQLGLEYGILADYLEGKIKDKKSLTGALQNKIHGFVRRQLTWFKKEKNIIWFDITDRNFSKNVEKLVAKWYYPI